MGDVVAALPAVASLKHSIPHSRIAWVIEPKWSMLLEGNPYVDSVITLERRTFQDCARLGANCAPSASISRWIFKAWSSRRWWLRVARPERIFGFTPIMRASRRRRGFIRQSSHPLLSCRGTKSGSGRGGGGDQHTPHFSASGRERRRAIYPPAISCWQVRWRVGAQSNGRWNIIANWPQALRRECGLPLVLNTAQPMDVAGRMEPRYGTARLDPRHAPSDGRGGHR